MAVVEATQPVVGTPRIGRPPRPIAERFWTKAKKEPSGCWLWTATTSNSGYGLFGCELRGRYANRTAHRVAYELTYGPIPPGLCVMHACDVKTCINPEHLRVGTIQDNHDDMWRKGRGRPPAREKHGMARLTEGQVAAIRARRRGGERVADLAAEHGLSKGHVYQILDGTRWPEAVQC